MTFRRIALRFRRSRIPVFDELKYLRSVEAAANEVADHVFDEGWLDYLEYEQPNTQLRGSINELARRLRHYHYDADGCVLPNDE